MLISISWQAQGGRLDRRKKTPRRCNAPPPPPPAPRLRPSLAVSCRVAKGIRRHNNRNNRNPALYEIEIRKTVVVVVASYILSRRILHHRRPRGGVASDAGAVRPRHCRSPDDDSSFSRAPPELFLMTMTSIDSGGIEGGEFESRVCPLVLLCTPHPPPILQYM